MAAIRTPEDFTDDAKKKAGGPSALARALGGVSSQAVSKWRLVPAERVLAVETITGISRHQLRPDVFGEPEQGRAA